jgi:hypothetical protein
MISKTRHKRLSNNQASVHMSCTFSEGTLDSGLQLLHQLGLGKLTEMVACLLLGRPKSKSTQEGKLKLSEAIQTELPVAADILSEFLEREINVPVVADILSEIFERYIKMPFVVRPIQQSHHTEALPELCQTIRVQGI